MSDASEIQSLLDNEHFDWSTHADSQLEFITDYNNLNYTSGSINFDLQTIRGRTICWRDSWLSIPITIVSSQPAEEYNDEILFGFKQSVLDLIYGVRVTSTSGQTIVADYNISIVNNLRLLVEKDRDWYDEEGPSLMFAKDATSLSTSGLGVLPPHPTIALNAGFLQRVEWIKQVSSSVDGGITWTAVISIPLRYIHDLFAKMSWPLTNNQFQFSFMLNAYSNQALYPFNIDLDTEPPPPLVTIGGPAGAQQNCRLYYKSITLSGEVQTTMAARMAAGFTKQVYFRCTDTYLPQPSGNQRCARHAVI